MTESTMIQFTLDGRLLSAAGEELGQLLVCHNARAAFTRNEIAYLSLFRSESA
ncbi:MAG: hypothetical protein AAGG44_14865 [Planctomycetota bacterium]